MRHLYKLWFKLSGWKFKGAFPKDIKSYIVIVGPHTANIDFIVGIMIRGILRINHVKYLGKSQLFKAPFGFIFRWLGGTPVERGKYNNLVEAVAAKFKDNKNFAIGLAPEGTREKVNRIKTGFYHIAKIAEVPIIMVGLDFGTKSIKIKKPFYPTDDVVEDFKQIIGFFSSCKGIKQERGITNEVFKNMKEALSEL
jgi:1-acyl-sn-glycerol-3-phosphate acyltransferase